MYPFCVLWNYDHAVYSLLPPQVFKSMADISAGEELYSRYSTVTEEDGGWLSLRDVVLARKMSRRMLVQPLTVERGKCCQPGRAAWFRMTL